MKLLLAAIFGLAALAAGAFAWHTHKALGETRGELASTKTQLDKAKEDLKALQDEAAALRKDAAARKAELEQMQAELSSARHFLEVERLASARMREEFARAMAARAAAPGRPGSTLLPGLILPMPLQSATPPPARIAPANRGVSIGVGVPAR